jgi:hypothetical protein
MIPSGPVLGWVPQQPSIDDSAKSGQLNEDVPACADLSLIALISAIFSERDSAIITPFPHPSLTVRCQFRCQLFGPSTIPNPKESKGRETRKSSGWAHHTYCCSK